MDRFGCRLSVASFVRHWPQFRRDLIVQGSFESNFTERSALSGALIEEGVNLGFGLFYQSTYEQPLTLGSAAGTYVGAFGDSVLIDAQGTVTSTTFSGIDCDDSFSGTAIPHGGVAVVTVTLTLAGGNCAGATVAGIAFYDASSQNLFIIATNSNGQALWFGGHRRS